MEIEKLDSYQVASLLKGKIDDLNELLLEMFKNNYGIELWFDGDMIIPNHRGTNKFKHLFVIGSLVKEIPLPSDEP